MVSKVRRQTAELKNCPNGLSRLVAELKTDSNEAEGGSDGKLCFSEKGSNVWEDCL